MGLHHELIMQTLWQRSRVVGADGFTFNKDIGVVRSVGRDIVCGCA